MAIETVTDEPVTDGRVARRERNRNAVLDAILGLFAEGRWNPSMEQIAERAGVSIRSVYRYFEQREQLMRAAVEHGWDKVGRDLTLDELGKGDFSTRVERFVAHRIRVFRELGPMIHSIERFSTTEPLIAAQYELGRRMLFEHFRLQFAPELERVPESDRADLTLLAYVPFTMEGIGELAEWCEHDDERVERILRRDLQIRFG